MTSTAKKHEEGGEEAPARIWLQVSSAHDRIFSEGNKTALKHLVIRLAIAGFAIHLLLIFLAKTLAHPPALIVGAGDGFGGGGREGSGNLAAQPFPYLRNHDDREKRIECDA